MRPTRIAVAMTVLWSLACAARVRPGPPVVTPAGVRFVVAHAQARSVAIAGTFNEWSATPLAPGSAPGTWTITLPLPPGDHRFMYVIDGTEWMSPPHAGEYEEDGFGARNGVIGVPPR